MGCMMSHRFALEKSSIVAGFGCHGGRMIQFGDAEAEKARFNVNPMPVYLTGGSEDAWFVNGTQDLNDWAALNECTGTSTVTRLTLDGGESTQLTLRSSGCKAPVASVVIEGMGHVTDAGMAANVGVSQGSSKAASSDGTGTSSCKPAE